jgi:hypothetical protein
LLGRAKDALRGARARSTKGHDHPAAATDNAAGGRRPDSRA